MSSFLLLTHWTSISKCFFFICYCGNDCIKGRTVENWIIWSEKRIKPGWFLGRNQFSNFHRAPRLPVCKLLLSVWDNSTVFNDIQFVECHVAFWKILYVLYSDKRFWTNCLDASGKNCRKLKNLVQLIVTKSVNPGWFLGRNQLSKIQRAPQSLADASIIGWRQFNCYRWYSTRWMPRSNLNNMSCIQINGSGHFVLMQQIILNVCNMYFAMSWCG